jgi:hypothetical protein
MQPQTTRAGMSTARQKAASRKEWAPHSPDLWSKVFRAVMPPGIA